jgi:hypothetical protein
MRWEGAQIPLDYIPLVLHLKTLPHALRVSIAKDILRDSDASVASTTLLEEFEHKAAPPGELSDVERWVSGLEDDFEPVPPGSDDKFADEESIQTKSPRKETSTPIPEVLEGMALW